MSISNGRASAIAVAIIAAAYALGLYAAYGNGYRLLSSDEMAYLAVAEAYADFDLWRAINGIRPNLPSLIAAPLVGIAGVDNLPVVRIAAYVFGFALLGMVFVFSRSLSLSAWRSLAVVLPLIPVVVLHSGWLGSDTLASAFAIAFVLVLSEGRYLRSDLGAAGSGLLFGVGLIAKTFLFYLSIVLLAFSFLYYFIFRTGTYARRDVVKRTVISLSVTFLIGIGWASLLQAKYGEFGFGAAGHHNFYVSNPDWVKKGWYFPHKENTNVGLLELPHPRSASYLEDPTATVTRLAPVYAWSPFDSAEHLRWFVGSIAWRTVHKVLPQDGAQSPLTLAMIFFAFLLLFARPQGFHFDANLFSVAALTISMGAILSVNFKFVYIFGFMLTILCVFSAYLYHLHDRKVLAFMAGPIAVILLAASFSITDLDPLRNFRAAVATAGKAPAQAAIEREAAELAPHLADKRLASVREFSFVNLARICFLARCGYLGNPHYDVPWPAQVAELRAHRIDFFATEPEDGRCGEARPGLELISSQPLGGMCLSRVLSP